MLPSPPGPPRRCAAAPGSAATPWNCCADQTPREFLDALLAREKYGDAIKFLAAALPMRQAVWWGCLCLQLARGSEMSAAEKAAVRAAARWALEPSEINRLEAVRWIVKKNPAGYLAQAVSWTGGSLSKPGLPVVPPGPQLPARALSGALLLAAVRCPPEKIKERFRHFLVLGIGLARKKQLQAPAAPARAGRAGREKAPASEMSLSARSSQGDPSCPNPPPASATCTHAR